MKELRAIQKELKAPKNQYSRYGDYHYRSCEDILEGVKPLLDKNTCILTINDELVRVGESNYVKSTATLTNSKGETVSATGFARETMERKKFDSSQLTGAASSYSGKRCLGNLFLLDDTKDADALAPEEKTSSQPEQPVKKISAAQKKKIYELMTAKDVQTEPFCAYFKIPSIVDMPVSAYDTAVKMLESKPTVKKG